MKDLKVNDILVFTFTLFDKMKKGEPFEVYIIKEIKKDYIICDIEKHGDPFFKKKKTEISERNLGSYFVKFIKIKKENPQYFI
jgi:hypothetical protein